MTRIRQQIFHWFYGGYDGNVPDTSTGGMTNTLQMFHIYTYNETKSDNQINDKCTVKPNEIFDVIIEKNTGRGHSQL
jgi:hypothetical protein